MTGAGQRPLVEVEAVRYRYGPGMVWALDGVSFQIGQGGVLGLVGPNGSGKTTLYRLLLGFIGPGEGRIAVGGRAPRVYRVQRGIGYLPEQVRLPGAVRIHEFAVLMARLAGLRGEGARSAIGTLVQILALQDKIDSRIASLSHGYRQRVGLLAVLLGGPELLLLDEPATGLDPASVGVLRTVLRALRRRGRTVIVSSHNLLELERVCDEVLILREGQLLGRAGRDELVRRPDIWIVQLDVERLPNSSPLDARRIELGGVRLAADEVAFTDREAARTFATAVRVGGGSVERVERRRFDLEFFFHSLVQGKGGEPGTDR